MKNFSLFLVVLFSVSFIWKTQAQTIPEIFCPAAIVVPNDTGNCSAVVTFDPATATDVEDGVLTTTQTLGLASGSNFPVGESIIEFSTTDSDANTVTCQFTITVQDTEVPIVVCKQDYEVELDADGLATINASDLIESVEENCSYTLDPVTVDLNCSHLGANTVNFTLTDMGGNLVNCSSSVVVLDVTAPVLIPQQNIIISLDVTGNYTITPCDMLATLDEACGIDVLLTDVTDVDCSDIGTPIFVTVFATDNSGNMTSCQQWVSVVDDMMPFFEWGCPNNVVMVADGNFEFYLPDFFASGDVSPKDNCTEPALILLTQTPVAGTYLEINCDTGEPPYIISFTAEDEYGNMAYCEFELIVRPPCSVEEESILNKSIKIYPNPASKEVSIMNSLSVTIDTVLLYNLQGRLLKQIDLKSIENNQIVIPTENFTAGMYFIRIVSGNESILKQLLIK